MSISPRNDETSEPSRNEVLEAIADARRRTILAVLLEGSAPVPEQELATELAAAETGTATGAIDDGTAETFLSTLRHLHLPKLEDVSLVEWDAEECSVEPTDHPAFEDPRVRELLATDADVDDVVECMADERRRLVLSVLNAYDDPMDRTELAREVTELESPKASSTEPSSGASRDVMVSLHHVHVPKLEDAGLVERDQDAETIQFTGHPELDDSWFTF